MKTDLIDGLIVGRVEPHIYAFSTETVPNYLKVGDTYRPVQVRLGEWSAVFPDLKERYCGVAKVNDDVYFRDHAVHRFLEERRHRARLRKDDLPGLPRYSREFFRDATVEDIGLAVDDIRAAYDNGGAGYHFYSFDDGRVPVESRFPRTEHFEPRPNQQTTIDRFKHALEHGRKNLLMYAVMRFGKSFTSMCCAVEMNARLVVVVSAKAEVLVEWKRTVESHVRFEGYTFMTSHDLEAGAHALHDKLESGGVVVFLTLQDLSGRAIKRRHRDVFGEKIDLLLIDESHYGARAEEYGRVLSMKKELSRKEMEDADTADAYEDNEALKTLDARIRIHLSGTPYRILMGSEFTKEDIIAFCQFSDIVDEQERWDSENALDDDTREWDNPYFGFPQMVRFAFLPNREARERLESLRHDGVSAALSELMRPCSIPADKAFGMHRKFAHEREVLALLRSIDGAETTGDMLPFLDLDQIKRGKMCRHIVMVLPYRASCDAMEAMLEAHREEFKNLRHYDILNIAGLDGRDGFPTVDSVRQRIEQDEAKGRKTMTLTVNRMLTGSTVKEWDTMLFLKDCASPQEYDQAIFRLQNQYVRTVKSKGGEEIKYNMKPQTLLVDFAPERMFRLQEQRVQLCNIYEGRRGGEWLRKRLDKELCQSPIVTIGNDGLRRVEAADIIDAVREYSSSRSVMDEAGDIPIDYALLEDGLMKSAIASLRPIDSRKGIDMGAAKGEEGSLGFSDATGGEEPGATPLADGPDAADVPKPSEDDLGKRLATYYARILFYAILTDSEVNSLSAVINSISGNGENSRIASNAGLQMPVLKLMQRKCNPFVLRALEYKIENVNSLMRDESLQPMKRAEVAMKKFGRLSSSEIVTPQHIAVEMIKALDEGTIDSSTKILDIASKQGEFARAIITVHGEGVRDNIYSLPTSGVAYEFTCKVYKMLGMNTDHVIADYTSYDLINERKEELMKKLKSMNLNVFVGNPPYQKGIARTEGNKSLSKQLYPKFIETIISLSPANAVVVSPTRWFTADAQDNSFPKLRGFLKEKGGVEKIVSFSGKSIFENIEIGDVALMTWKKGYEGNVLFRECFDDATTNEMERPLFEENFDLVLPLNKYVTIIKKVVSSNGFASINSMTTGRDVFGLPGKGIEKKTSDTHFEGACRVRCSKERVRYANPSLLGKSTPLVDCYKVFISKANGGAGLITDNKPVKILGKSYVGRPGDVCTDSLIVIGKFDNENYAVNLQKYLSTKFLRFMVGILKVSQNLYQNVYKLVPLQDFTPASDIDWSGSVAEVDRQLYAKYGLSDEEVDFIERMVAPME